MDVSIIIINYNTRQMTNECIDSIFEKTHDVSFEIILVDNASTDGSKEFFDADTRIRYVYNSENLGFGRANNIGMKMARGKYFLLLNSDTLLLNNAVKEFYDYAEFDNEDAIYGCYLRNVDMSHARSFDEFPSMSRTVIALMCKYINIIRSKTSIQDCTKVTYVDSICGACLFIKKTTIESVGYFNKFFFMYYEETELQYRMLMHSINRILIPHPDILHIGGESIKSYSSYEKSGIVDKSLMIFFKLHSHYLSYVAFRCAYAILRIPAIIFNSHNNTRNKLQYIKILLHPIHLR